MSKFVDKLQRVYLGQTSSIGFRKSAEAGSPPLLFVATLSPAGIKGTKAIAGIEIDAGIISSESVDAGRFKELAISMQDIPLGLSLEGAKQKGIDEFIDAGCDFIVFGLNTPLEAANKEGIGKILKIETSLEQGLIRTINELPLSIDGVLVTAEDSSITVGRLLVYQRFAELLDKPLLVSSEASVTSSELSSLCEAGIKGLVLPEGVSAKIFAELRKTTGSLPRVAKGKAKGGALLPQIHGVPEAPEVEVEEEDEEI